MTYTVQSMSGVAGIVVATLLSGCNGQSSSVTSPGSLPSGIRVQPPTGSTGGETLVPDVAGLPLSVSAIAPNIGSTAGGDLLIRITGSGFRVGARITLGGVSLPGFVINGTTIAPTTLIPPHAAGTVDVTVSNADGQSATIINGFTYAPPESFDPNGDWEGSFPELTPIIKFTIEHNLLTRVSCGTSEAITFMPATLVSGGEFSASSADGVSVVGRIVAPAVANGTANIAGCPVQPFIAERKSIP